MKNPNGYGTVYKLPGSRRRPFVAKVTAGWNSEGKQLYQVVGYYQTRAEAMLALAGFHKSGGTSTEWTLEEVYEKWSAEHFQNIAPSTRNQYESAFKKMRALHKQNFSSIKTKNFQKVIEQNSAQKSGTLRKIKVLANQLTHYALQNDLTDKDYARFIQLPKQDNTVKQVFTDNDIQLLWNHVGNEITDSVLILIYTGLRVGELLQLTKEQVDFNRAVLTGGLKTDAGKNRLVPIHPKIDPLLQTRCNQVQNRLYEFTYSQFRSRFNQLLTSLRITPKTPHCTRHTFATLMARGGADAKALQEIIGHADYSTTANIYTHMNLQDLEKAIKCI